MPKQPRRPHLRLRVETYSRKPLLGRRQHSARIVNDNNGKEQWRTSESYNNRDDLLAAIYALEYMGSAIIVDLDSGPIPELGI